MDTKVNNNESGNMEVMNQVIVRLNEMKAVKMASISKSKRPAAKFNKEVATYLLDNWDNLDQLKTCQKQMRLDMPHTTCTEIMGMYDARVADLQAEIEKERVREEEAKLEASGKEVSMTNGERIMLSVFIKCIESERGFHLTDVNVAAAKIGYTQAQVKAFAKKLQEKGLVIMFDAADCKFDGEITALGMEEANKATESAKNIKKAKKQAQENVEKNKKRPGAPKIRKVGDRHPNGKWIWTEYEPGRFDWRTDPELKAKNAAERAAKMAASKGNSTKVKTQPKKQKTTKAATKAKKSAEPKKAPAISIDEMLSRQAPSGLSKAQKNVLGLLKKGYRMTMIGTGVFLQKDDDRKSVEVSTVKALIERYKLDAEPTGLWIETK